jgi:hypothetical protein
MAIFCAPLSQSSELLYPISNETSKHSQVTPDSVIESTSSSKLLLLSTSRPVFLYFGVSLVLQMCFMHESLS